MSREFGELVRKRRIAKGWTQTELGKRANLSHSYPNKIEGGLLNPTYPMVKSMIEALEVPPEEQPEFCLVAFSVPHENVKAMLEAYLAAKRLTS